MPRTRPEPSGPSSSAPTAQRLRNKAQQIRAEREERARIEPEGERATQPEDEAEVFAGPIVDEESEIAREEALSTMVPANEMRRSPGHPGEGGVPGDAVERVGEEIVDLGRELSTMVDERLDNFREELSVIDQKPPRGFIYGSAFGFGMAFLGFFASIFLTKWSRRE